MQLVHRPLGKHGKALLVLLAALATLIWAALAPAPASAWQPTCSEPVCDAGDPAGAPGGASSDPSDPWPWESDPSGPNPGRGDGEVGLGDEHPDGAVAGTDDTGDHSYERPDPQEEPGDYRGYETTDPRDVQVVDPTTIFKHTRADDASPFPGHDESPDDLDARRLRNNCRRIVDRAADVSENGVGWVERFFTLGHSTKNRVLRRLETQYKNDGCPDAMQDAQP
jgi:hypothetical protein